MIILLGFGLRMFNLGHRNYYGDEPQVIRTAAGRLYSDTYEQWCFYNKRMTGNHYDRAWPHTWAIAQTYKVFGISEWSSRLVSVLFGTLMLVVAYPLAKELFNAEPEAYILGIRGYDFNEFAEKLSPKARENLQAAFEYVTNAMQQGFAKSFGEVRPEGAALDE